MFADSAVFVDEFEWKMKKTGAQMKGFKGIFRADDVEDVVKLKLEEVAKGLNKPVLN